MEKSDFKILVAEDDEITRDMMAGLLAEEGYPVVSAVDGLDAIRLLRLEDVSMVITDYKMPSADGIEVLKHAVKINPDAAVVLLTAYGSLDTILATIKGGAYDYIAKPFNNQQILFVVEKAFQRAMLIDENRELTKQLRDTYRDIEFLRKVAERKEPDVTMNWLERLQKLTERGILSGEEADVLRERLLSEAPGVVPHEP